MVHQPDIVRKVELELFDSTLGRIHGDADKLHWVVSHIQILGH